MIVTEITPLDKRRSKVFLDEDFALVLYRGEIKRYRIEEGKDLSSEAYEEIVKTVLYKRARERILYLLKASDKTEQELRRKLTDSFYPQEAVDYAIEFGKKYHYIDDDSYGHRYLEINSARKSRRQISYELQQKGISREDIQELMEVYPNEEEEQVRKLVKKKHYHPDTATREERQKVTAYLMRRGFSYEIVGKIMGEDQDYQPL